MKRDYAQAVREADLVYVGGGNTVAMLVVWREFGLDLALREAYAGGTVLAGISAGANCWFEHYITDSIPGGGTRAGMGLLPGTFCPHLDSEVWRQPMLAATHGVVAGAGENVCVFYENEQWQTAVHSAAPESSAKPLCLHRSTEYAPDAPLLTVAPQALPANPR
jgi:peptidase E